MGLEGKFHPMGSGRRDIRRRGCTVYIGGVYVEESWKRAEGELREEAGVGVCVSDRVLLCVSQYQPDRFRCLYG